jgi:hypothetical protein
VKKLKTLENYLPLSTMDTKNITEEGKDFVQLS